MLPRCIACLGKDTLIGFLLITFTRINTFSYSLYMKTALTGYVVSMARILYVHVIGAIALLPRCDYFAMIIDIASMARILYVHVTGGITHSSEYFACFVGVSSSSGFAYLIY